MFFLVFFSVLKGGILISKITIISKGGNICQNVKEITRESWILATFPEWGTWLNEEIEEEVVPEGNFAMWWLGNCGTWIKTPGGANVVMDLWSNRGKSTKKVKDMVRGHQMANMAGVRKLQPNFACSANGYRSICYQRTRLLLSFTLP